MFVVDSARVLIALLSETQKQKAELNLFPLIQCFNNTDCRDKFLSTERGSRYENTLKRNKSRFTYSRGVITFLRENAVMVCLGLAVYNDHNAMARDFMPYCSDPRNLRDLSLSKETLGRECDEFMVDFHVGLRSDEARLKRMREAVLELINWYLAEYLELIRKEEEQRVVKIASYLSSRQQMQCFLLSYVHNAKEIFATVTNMLLPARKIIWRCTDGASIDFDTWRILSQFLPQEIKQISTLINDFKTAIYSPESRHIASMYGPKAVKHGTISVNIPTSVIIQQIVCMSLENWDEIWFKNKWPRHPELVKRLLFYRKVYGGRLEPRLPLLLVFSQ